MYINCQDKLNYNFVHFMGLNYIINYLFKIVVFISKVIFQYLIEFNNIKNKYSNINFNRNSIFIGGN